MKKNQLWLGVCVVILCLGILGGLWGMRVQSDPSVRIVQNGAVLYRFDLSSAEDQTFTVEYEGRSNIIQIEDGAIRVLEADCPDQTCVHMGWLDSAAPIVCLPNRLVIEFDNASDETDTVIE